MKWNPKQKKWMLIAGGAVICIVLAVAIGSQFRKQPGAGDVILPEETEDTRIILADLPHRVDIELERTEGESDDHEAEEPEVVVRTETGAAETVQEALPPQTDREEQKLQKEVAIFH